MPHFSWVTVPGLIPSRNRPMSADKINFIDKKSSPSVEEAKPLSTQTLYATAGECRLVSCKAQVYSSCPTHAHFMRAGACGGAQ